MTPDPIGGFTAELRRVHEQAGRPDPATVGARAGVDPAVVSAALSGAALPPLAATLAIVGALGGIPAGWEERWRAAMQAQLGGAPTAPVPPRAAPPVPAAPAAPPMPAAPAAPPPPPPRAYPTAPATPPEPPTITPGAFLDAPGATERSAGDGEVTSFAPAFQHQPPPVPQPAPQPAPPQPVTATAPNPALAAPRPRGSWDGPDRASLGPLEADDPRAVGGYALRARLGAGGMGRVYLSNTPGGRPVAVKVIRSEFADDQEFRRRFRQEVTAAQRVQGMYTAPVIDSDANAPQPWLATAFVAGPSLHEAVLRHGPLPTETAIVLVAGVAEALASIHAADVVHRDLKPSNVILAVDGPRVIDFGIARAADATPLTRTGMSIGTPAFMAPEQAQGHPAAPATDVFALGAMAVFASTGTSAFGEGTDSSVLYRVVHQEPDVGAVPAQLRPVVDACLAKDPAQRPSPAQIIEMCRAATSDTRLRIGEGWLPATLGAEVTRRMNEQPPKLPKDPAVGKRRRRRALVAAVVVLVLAAGGTGAYLGLNHKSGGGGRANASSSTPATTGTGTFGGANGSASNGTSSPTASPDTTPPVTSGNDPGATGGDASPTDSGATAGGVAEGGVINTYSNVNIPAGYYFNLTAPDTPVSGYYGDISIPSTGNSAPAIGGNEMVLLDPGQTANYQTCLTDTRYTNAIPTALLKAGSHICARNAQNRLIADIQVIALPSTGQASTYWTFTVTVWRGPQNMQPQ